MTITETNPIVPGVKTSDGTVARAAFQPALHTHSTSEVDGLNAALADKATANHNHAISSLTGYAALNTAIAGKAESNHTHPVSAITDLSTRLNGMSSRITALEADQVDPSTLYTKTQVDALIAAAKSKLGDVTTLSHDVDSNTPLDISTLDNGEVCYLHTSAASITLSSCITSSISGTTIHYNNSDGSLTTRNFIIRKYRMGTHFFVEVISSYND